MSQSYDYIIVGAGSAGCVLANRLSADPANRVLVIEAGARRAGLMSVMPAGVYNVYSNPRINWNYQSEPEANMQGRALPVPRGKVIGGSSAINSMVYLRGHPQDYDGWDAAGATGWDYKSCLPYFRRSETSDTGANAYRGGDGPLSVEGGKLQSPIFDAFLAAAEDAGHPISDDLNGEQPEGFARIQATKKDGKRCSTAVAYLLPALSRPNLTLMTDTHVARVQVEDGRATGVVLIDGKQETTLTATREVILSGGAINSPQLLMLSGIGPADHLAEHGIAVKHDLPGVGSNLQDHADVLISYRTREPISVAWLNSPVNKAMVGAQWLLTRTGIVSSNIFEVGGLFRSAPGVNRSDLQVHLAPVMVEYGEKGILLFEGYTVHLSQLRQESRGTIRLKSADPLQAPAIRFNFLTTDRDRQDFRDGIARIREIVAQGPLADITASEVVPGADLTTDAQLDAFVETMAETEYHPSCTCRMGTDDQAVVTPDLKVRGSRVCGWSMPR